MNIPDASSTFQTRKTLIQMNKTDVAYSLQQNFESRSRFKMSQKNCYFEILYVEFMSRAVWDEKFSRQKT